jgi:hypothetical protein
MGVKIPYDTWLELYWWYIGTDCSGGSKSNYHTTMAMTVTSK